MEQLVALLGSPIIEIVLSPPMTAAGKIVKRQLR
jgi:hypothetical protein